MLNLIRTMPTVSWLVRKIDSRSVDKKSKLSARGHVISMSPDFSLLMRMAPGQGSSFLPGPVEGRRCWESDQSDANARSV